MIILDCLIGWKDLILLGFGFFGTFLWLVIIYFIKPSLTINEPKLAIEKNELRIPVLNYGYFDAVNIKIEACAVDNNEFTYHFFLDSNEFIAIISKKCTAIKNSSNERIFKSNELTPSTLYYGKTNFDSVKMKLLEGKNTLRIRIHSCHSFTGFGRLQEFNFKYENGKFVPLKI